MSIKKIIGSVALNLFDFFGLNDKMEKKASDKIKKKERKKSNKNKKTSSFFQMNLFETGGKYDENIEPKSNVHNSDNKKSETEFIQGTTQKFGDGKHTERNGGSVNTKNNINRTSNVSTNSTGQFSFLETANNQTSNTSGSDPIVTARINRGNSNILVQNYKITCNDKLGEGSLNKKCQDNIQAIELMKFLEKDGRKALKEEQKKLVKFVGWGGLAQNVFSENVKKGWEFLSRKVKSILSDSEYEAAAKSSLTAFYTPINIIQFIYHALEKMGFTGGRILEPSCGIGHFIGCLPEKIKNHVKITGVEIDSISSRIANLLYPKCKIYNKGFQEVEFDDSSFDLIIGNIPFGDLILHDKRYNKLNLKIHNYFFAKSLDLVREGGIIAFITSHYTMDSKNDTFRKYISKKANLLAAVRLPNSAFKSANTETITDIIFLQKREEGSQYSGESWFNLSKVEEGIKINEYFERHPQMILGKLSLSKHTNQYGQYEMIVEDSEEKLETLLNSILKYLPKNIYNEIENSSAYLFEEDELLSINDYPDIQEHSFEIIEDKLYQRQGKYIVPVIIDSNKERRIRGMIDIKKALQDVINFQVYNSNDIGLKNLQINLESTYNSFIKNYKHLNSQENKRAFEEDPFYPLLSSLEIQNPDGSFQKADIFSKRTIPCETKISHVDTIEEALTVSLNTNLKINFSLMSKITDKSIGEIKKYLLEKQLIFKNPNTDSYETSDEYLSGKVKDKLKAAKNINIAENFEYKYNVEALTKVQPVPLDFTDINVKLGSSWVPSKYVKEFIIYLLELDSAEVEKFDVFFCKVNATWEIDTCGKNIRINNYKNHSQWGTQRASALKLIEHCLNLKDTNVYDRVYDDAKGKEVSKLNRKETVVARQKQTEIKNEFKEWIWKDRVRRDTLCELYNSLFNSWVNRSFDGSKLQLHGINILAPKLRDYQNNVIQRILYTGNTLIGHCVGAGKTFSMVASGVEMKRLGLCKKPMYVIPNSLVESGQFAREFLQLYPTAKILVATSKDFQADKRKKFISRIAVGDYDAIIIGHSSFGLIPVSKETQEKFIREEISELTYAIESFSNKKNRTVKQLEKTKQNLEEKLKKLLDMPKDNLLTFEQLGIDQLFVDEAHNFKNLQLYSKLRNVAGIPSNASQKATDMFIKTQYLINKNGSNRGVVFATGTPVSNTMAELYTMQRFLMLDTLKELDLYYFDAWASAFGEIISSIEINGTGTGYRTKLRFAKFNNVPELLNIFRKIADIVTEDMIDIPGKPVLENNEYIVRQISKCEEVENYIQSLIERAKDISDGKVKPHEDNMLCVVNDGKKVALDPRLVGINVDYHDSKINTTIRDIYNEWLSGKNDKSTILVFCDLGTPKTNDSSNKTIEELLDTTNFNIYEDIKGKLMKIGVPKEEIAFIHDANTPVKKNKLFRDFKAGIVRILLGSTSKMGEGCNLQDRLKSLFHLDCPWRPADLKQREGRILRMGNMNKSVRIYRYGTKGTFDGFCWQTVETKAKFIAQIMNGSFKGRSIEDIDEQLMSFAQMKAICSENPMIAEKIKNDIEIARLQALENGFNKQQYLAEAYIESNKKYIKENKEVLNGLYKDLELANNNLQDKFAIVINNKTFTERKTEEGNFVTGKKDAGEYILELFESIDLDKQEVKLGEYRGFQLFAMKSRSHEGYYIEKELVLKGSCNYYIDCYSSTGLGLIQKLENKIENIEYIIEEKESKIKNKTKENIGYTETLSKKFEFKEELTKLQKRQAELNAMLDLNTSSCDLGLDDGDEENIDDVAS